MSRTEPIFPIKRLKSCSYLLIFHFSFFVFHPSFSQTSPESEIESQIKSWILVNNKIKGDIHLTPFDFGKIEYNTMELRFMSDGKLSYRYHSNVEACGGNFLDIDIENSYWERRGAFMILTIRGGYWSIDDFEFKRVYTIEPKGDDFVLKKMDEYYYKRLNEEETE